MIPIEELKPYTQRRRCWRTKPFDDTYWGIETRLAGGNRKQFWYTFDDTYWGIETRTTYSTEVNRLTFDDTYWGIETRDSVGRDKCQLTLLMIPIEELKLGTRRLSLVFFCFWWYLLRNWNDNQASFSAACKPFWWYLLRNWNYASYFFFASSRPFDDTYWGIETTLFFVVVLSWPLLMIPIEELKLPNLFVFWFAFYPFWWYLLRNWNTKIVPWQLNRPTFDDTYWGIETHQTCRKSNRQPPFDDTYWGIETFKCTAIFSTSRFPFDDTYWGIETSTSLKLHKNPCRFWWYLLRNWNPVRLCMLAYVPSFDDTYWGIETVLGIPVFDKLHPFDDTYWGIETSSANLSTCSTVIFWWYLLRNWNCQMACFPPCSASFWWYLLRNWNPHQQGLWYWKSRFWWYLLRNWNWLSGANCFRGHHPFDDTYWGIETPPNRIPPACPLLLMIPIEELKPAFVVVTYLTLELLMIPIEELKLWWSRQAGCIFRFWWYLLRNWNSSESTWHRSAWSLLMIPIEELKLFGVNRPAGWPALLMIPIEELKHNHFLQQFPFGFIFWWYLLRNWNADAKASGEFDGALLMIPIEELKQVKNAKI